MAFIHAETFCIDMEVSVSNIVNIWLVRIGEPLPIDENKQRLFRMGLIAEEFAKTGANITWFASTFDHNLKRFRFEKNTEICFKENYSICLLHGRRYSKNISINRLLHYRDERRQFERIIEKKDRPDVILVSMPNIDLAYAAVRFGLKHNVPVFVDVRDLWPDLYEDYFPRFKKIVHYAIIPFKKQLAYTLKNATGIFATSEKFLDWALDYAGRTKCDNDGYYYVSYPDTNLELSEDDFKFWKDMGVSETDLLCVFFGQFGHAVNLELIMKTALITAKDYPRIKYVICGVGEKLKDYKEIIKDSPNVLFPGWVDHKQIIALGRMSSVGLLAYRENKNYEWSMPNKFCEYLALGLCVVVEPSGMMAELINSNDIGVKYSNEYDLANYLMNLESNRDKLLDMKKRARKLYEEKFMANVTYGEMVNRIKEIIS